MIENLDLKYRKVLARVQNFSYIDERVKTFSLLFELEDWGHQAITGHQNVPLCQAITGYQLTEWHSLMQRMVPSASGLDMVEQLKEVFGVSDLIEAKGRLVYCLYKKPQTIGSLIGGVSRLSMDFKTDDRNYFTVDDWRNDWFPEDEQ